MSSLPHDAKTCPCMLCVFHLSILISAGLFAVLQWHLCFSLVYMLKEAQSVSRLRKGTDPSGHGYFHGVFVVVVFCFVLFVSFVVIFKCCIREGLKAQRRRKTSNFKLAKGGTQETKSYWHYEKGNKGNKAGNQKEQQKLIEESQTDHPTAGFVMYVDIFT